VVTLLMRNDTQQMLGIKVTRCAAQNLQIAAPRLYQVTRLVTGQRTGKTVGHLI